MKISKDRKALTLIEVLVLIGIVIVLFSIAVPGGSSPDRAALTFSLNNAKQIGYACRNYAIDHDGQYPGYVVTNGTNSKILISDYSNTAFDQLLPDYLQTITLFHQRNSAWTPGALPPDPSEATMKAGKSLPAGTNEWAYVTSLTVTSGSSLPLIANGFADLNTHAYTTDDTARGGVWKGVYALLVFTDNSAKVMRCDPSTHRIPGSPNGLDLFDTSGQPGWLNSPAVGKQIVLNPQ